MSNKPTTTMTLRPKPTIYKVKTIRGTHRFQSQKNAMAHAEFIFNERKRYVLVTETKPGETEKIFAEFKINP